MRRALKKRRVGSFRPSSLTQHPQPRTGHAPSARELFPILRDMLAESRAQVEPQRVVKHTHQRMRFVYKTDKKTGLVTRTRELKKVVDVQTTPAVFGKPAFKNAIIEGEHV